jgi:hypothetical protein
VIDKQSDVEQVNGDNNELTTIQRPEIARATQNDHKEASQASEVNGINKVLITALHSKVNQVFKATRKYL